MRTSKCYRVLGPAVLGCPGCPAWPTATPLEGCTPQLPPPRLLFHSGLAQSPYPDWNLDKGAGHPPFSSSAGKGTCWTRATVCHPLSWCGLRQHLIPGCHLPSAPMVMGGPIFSCTEFPRSSYACTLPFKAEAWRRGPEDSLPVPTWLLVITGPNLTQPRPLPGHPGTLASMQLGALADITREGAGTPSHVRERRGL